MSKLAFTYLKIFKLINICSVMEGLNAMNLNLVRRIAKIIEKLFWFDPSSSVLGNG